MQEITMKKRVIRYVIPVLFVLMILGIYTNHVRAEEIGPDITGTISDITVKEGTSPTLSIAASRDDLTYAWEYKYYGSNTWEPWGTGNPFTPQWTANSLWQHLSYRVRVTDTQGRSAVSNEGHVTVEPEIPLSITKQPGQITVYEGQYTIITANTTGEGLHYKWQYQYPNQGWMPWGESDQADFTPRWTANRGWQGLKYRYTVTDKFGYQMTSAEGTVNVAARNNATITGGVQDITVKEGTSPTVSIAATGDGLKYNWEYKYYGSNSWQPWGSGKSFTPRWTANALWQHLSYRVKVTDVYGDAVYSNTGTVTVEPVTRLVITEQPKEITVKEGQHTTITAKATGEGLHYSWQYQYPNQGWMPWGESDQADFTPRWTANSGWTGIHYRYIVTDKFGYQLTSEAGRVGVAGRSYTKVIGSISNISVQRGTSPTVHIDATGDGLQYSWEYKYYGSNSWEPWGSGKSFTPRWTANDLWENLSYRAKVVDQYGNTEYSNTGIVTVTEAPTIRIKTTLPDLMVSEGEPAHLSAEAEGDGLTYTWQYQYPGKEWASWGTGNPYTTPYTANQSWIGIKYRVLVSDRYGNTSTSNEGSVDVRLKLRIISEIGTAFVNEGADATFHVDAIGNGLNYIWQYKYPNQSWMNWGTNYTDNPFTTQYTADASWNGIGYRVIVTDKWGDSAISTGQIFLRKIEKGQGIDVSKFQGNINWAVTKNYINFAIIRSNNHTSNGDYTGIDPYFEKNMKEAKANGVPVGVYYYSDAVNENDAITEANRVVNLVRENGGITLPIFIDTEGSQQNSLSKDQRTRNVQAFIDTVNRAGLKAGVYSNKNTLENMINMNNLHNAYVWVAQYNTNNTYSGHYDIWQYSSSGSIPGIRGRVDMDLMY